MEKTHKQKKAQASVEFMIAISVVLLIFVISSYFVYFKITRNLDYKLYLHGTHTVDDIAKTINTVNNLGNGYSILFTAPQRLYGERPYVMRFYRDEPSIFIEGGAFSTGRTLTFSAPISTIYFNCLLDECFTGCNNTQRDTCLNVTDHLKSRIKNYEGNIYITPLENINQPTKPNLAGIQPHLGEDDPYTLINQTVEDLLTSTGSVIYLVKERENNTLSLVFKHYNQVSVEYEINNSITPEMRLSDDLGELDLTQNPQGRWMLNNPDLWDGGILWFNKTGFRTCIKPTGLGGNWYWINPKEIITLDKTEKVCITYP